ncbi:FAD-dependent monooxygenase [Streptomyces sp. MUM 203J]|uniref:FAD-dependent oxidoreductase n=1 Tax=Streptomyces sp. MUM 203J TaxID=2791990 RepID=UPI001F04BAA9|nr:FAD-dependent monooxygenase [Streptomyces sp. MUM 203J]MCH0542707.1 FAD-dependent monooxygenase [Streptomyces sp. MUM 203J]
MDPVIVVGAGPVGLSLALALAAQEVPTVVLDEGEGREEHRPARTAVLRADTAAFVQGLGCAEALRHEGASWSGWRSLRRKQLLRTEPFATPVEHDEPSGVGSPAQEHPAAPPPPLHIPQHALTTALREAIASLPGGKLVEVVHGTRLERVEQDPAGVTAHTRGRRTAEWRGGYLVGCDGARSTVRKLLEVRFPGRTAVERHAVAMLRTELPWPGESVLHRRPPWRGGGDEVTARPLPDGGWRLDWLLPPRGELVTPDALVWRIRETLSGWCENTTPVYELLDTGVYTVHHRLARRWRVGRAFLAGDAAHLVGAVGTQGLDEGLRDVRNLAWKLAQAWHEGPSDVLLDSYQAERRTAVAARLRAADQALPVLRGGGGLRTCLRAGLGGQEELLADAHLGRGPLGAPPAYPLSPLAPDTSHAEHTEVGTDPGQLVTDVPVTSPDGTASRLQDRLGRGLLVVLVAPGTGVWDRRHWVRAGVMPRLAEAVRTLPMRGELLVAESYPGAAAHTVLLVRPDGHLAAALSAAAPSALHEAARTTCGGDPDAVTPPGVQPPKQGARRDDGTDTGIGPAAGTGRTAGAPEGRADGTAGTAGAASAEGTEPRAPRTAITP